MFIYAERIKSALGEIAKTLKLKTFRFEYKDVDEKSENYHGVMVPITLIEERSDGEMRRQLLAKMSTNKKEIRDLGLYDYLYTSESFFYTKLLPLFKGLSRIDLSDLFVECYYADTKRFQEIIIFEDVCERGFRQYQRNRFLDFDHVVASLHSLALFHALSIVFQNQIENTESTDLNLYFLDYPPGLLTTSKGSINNNLEIFRGTKHEEFFNNLAANFANAVNDCVHKAKYLTYGHGDFWKENVMFKYEDNKPVKACIIDFQSIRLMSPAQDVLCFLLTSTSADLRRSYYDFFVETYYSHLRNTLLDYSLDLNMIYSKNDFVCDLKTVSPYCFIVVNMSFSLWLGLEKDGLLKSKAICHEEDENSAAVALYKQTMLDIAEDFSTFGLYTAK